MSAEPFDPVLDPALRAPVLEAALADQNESTAEAQVRSSGSGLARATSLLAVGTIASRVLGFAQELLMAHFFGTVGGLVDAFQIAITVPRDLYDLAISGYVNSALVPVLSEYAANDRDELWRLTSALLGIVTFILSGLTLLLELFARPVVAIYRGTPNSLEVFARPILPGYPYTVSPEAITLTVNLLRITTPALLFLGTFSLLAGVLYALKQFSAPAFGSAVFNGILVIALVLLTPVLGIERAAIGWLLGAIAQLALQIAALRHSPIRLQLNVRAAVRHPGVRRIGRLYLPVALSLVVDVLINRTFSYHLASQAGSGDIAYMNWATSVREFPMGLVGTAISIAVLPTLARQALDKDLRQAFADTLGQGIRLVLTLILPATVGLFVLAGPLIGLLFEHGAFTVTDTTITALVLRLYLLGIPFAAVDLLLIFAFYAHKDTLTPALIGVFSLACYMLIALALQSTYGFYGLMIADSVKFLIHTTLSVILLRRKLGGLGGQRLPLTLLKTGLATLATGLIAYAVMRGVTLLDTTLQEQSPLLSRLALVFLPSAAGGLTYLGMVYVLRIHEFAWFVDALRRRAVRR
ncbi:MAG: murein biosynthesis integral membrane protein MurJ [Aggregatilineales bacterium]